MSDVEEPGKVFMPTFPTISLPTLPSFDTTKDYSQFFIALVFCFFISIFIIKILRSIQ